VVLFVTAAWWSSRRTISKDKQISNRSSQVIAANRFTKNKVYGKYTQFGMTFL